MILTINTISSPKSCNHIHLDYDVNGVNKVLALMLSDFQLDPDDETVALVTLIRNFAKENNISTRAALKTALEGKIFKL